MKLVVRLFALVLLIGVIVLAVKARRPPERTLDIGYVPVGEATPLIVAVGHGYFRDVGLDVRLHPLESGPLVINAMIGGSLQGGLAGIVPVANAAEKGVPLRIVADGGHIDSVSAKYFGLMVETDSPIRTPTQLAGKKVAVNGYKTIEDGLIRAMSSRYGLKDITPEAMPHGAMLGALQNHSVDAAIAIEPYLSAGEASGHTRLLMSSEEILPGFQLSFIIFSPSYVRQYPRSIRGFQEAYLRARTWIAANPDSAKSLLVSTLGVPSRAAERITLPSWEDPIDGRRLDRVLQSLVGTGVLERDPALDTLAVPGLIRE